MESDKEESSQAENVKNTRRKQTYVLIRVEDLKHLSVPYIFEDTDSEASSELERNEDTEPDKSCQPERVEDPEPEKSSETEKVEDSKPETSYGAGAVKDTKAIESSEIEQVKNTNPGKCSEPEGVEATEPGKSYETERVEDSKPEMFYGAGTVKGTKAVESSEPEQVEHTDPGKCSEPEGVEATKPGKSSEPGRVKEIESKKSCESEIAEAMMVLPKSKQNNQNLNAVAVQKTKRQAREVKKQCEYCDSKNSTLHLKEGHVICSECLSRFTVVWNTPKVPPKEPKECVLCGETETSRWRIGPMGIDTLCDECGRAYNKRKPTPYCLI